MCDMTTRLKYSPVFISIVILHKGLCQVTSNQVSRSKMPEVAGAAYRVVASQERSK